jgi:hypothetical protein
MKDGSNVVFVNGKPGPPAITIAPPVLVAPDGGRVVYQASVKSDLPRGVGWVIVVGDQIATDPFPDVLALVMSTDGRRIGYGGGDKQFGSVVGVGDHHAPTRFQDVHPPLAFSSDGNRLAAAVKLGDSWQIVVGGVTPSSEGAAGVQFFFAEVNRPLGDGSSYRWTLRNGSGDRFEDVKLPAFSSDGKEIAFAGKRSDKWHVVHRRTSPAFDDIGSIALAPQGDG